MKPFDPSLLSFESIDLIKLDLVSTPFSRSGGATPEWTETVLQRTLTHDEASEALLVFFRVAGKRLGPFPKTGAAYEAIYRLVYHYAEFRDVVEISEEEGKPNPIDQSLYVTLLSTAYSTVRGLLRGVFADSEVSDLVLPILTVEDLLQMDEVDLEIVDREALSAIVSTSES